VGTIRSAVNEVAELHKMCYVGATHGLPIMLAMATKKADPEFTKDDEKALAAALKQQHQAMGGGKAKGKLGNPKPYDRSEAEATTSSWGWHGMPFPLHNFMYGNMGEGLRLGDRYEAPAEDESEEDE
jgi:hypothetical protein